MTGEVECSGSPIRISALPHTWLIDVDGVILAHNGHKQIAERLLPGVRAFWAAIPESDVVVLLSARTETEKPATLAFLQAEGLRFDQAIFGLPTGERILINDAKPSGLITAVAITVERDEGLAGRRWEIDPAL